MRRVCFLLVIILCMAMITRNDLNAQSNTHRDKTIKLFNMMELDKFFAEAIDKVRDVQEKQMPQLSSYRSKIKLFLDKYMSWKSLKEDFARIYMDVFTEKEIDDLLIFYETPTGKKAVKNLPVLMNKGMEVGQKRVQEHQKELEQMLRQ